MQISIKVGVVQAIARLLGSKRRTSVGVRERRRDDLAAALGLVAHSPNANTFLGPKPVNVPLPQYTMPSEMEAPAAHGAPLLYDQRTAPVLA
jgi:hypothetical protein